MSAIKLNPVHAELIFLAYANNKNALESLQALLDDPGFPANVKNDCIRPIVNKHRWIKSALDVKVPRENCEIHQAQLKDNDTMRLNEIQRLFTRMTPDQQELLERVATGLVNGEVIEFHE